MINENKEELNKWKDTMVMGRKTQNYKISIFPNLIYRFNAVPSQIPANCFVDIDKLISRYVERQKTLSSQHNIKGEEQG